MGICNITPQISMYPFSCSSLDLSNCSSTVCISIFVAVIPDLEMLIHLTDNHCVVSTHCGWMSENILCFRRFPSHLCSILLYKCLCPFELQVGLMLIPCLALWCFVYCSLNKPSFFLSLPFFEKNLRHPERFWFCASWRGCHTVPQQHKANRWRQLCPTFIVYRSTRWGKLLIISLN